MSVRGGMCLLETDDVEIFFAEVAEEVAAAVVGEDAIDVECRHTQRLRKTDARWGRNRCVIEIRHLLSFAKKSGIADFYSVITRFQDFRFHQSNCTIPHDRHQI